MTIKQLYDYQEAMAAAFLGDTGKPQNLIVQAPTGAGKTLGALYPGIAGFADEHIYSYPQRIIYGVPMRVLANSFVEKYRNYHQVFPDWRREWNGKIQTGERPEDSLFEGQLTFATVDQMLASFLNMPYSIPKRLDNINAGAFIGSYLIFDEFHLYPSEQMMLTVLAMLKMLTGITRFTLMSATFSPALVQAIGDELGAQVIAEDPNKLLSAGIFSDIDHLHDQQRTWRAREGTLSAQHIQAALSEHRKALVICNTVDRAQEIYEAFMRMDIDADCVLLHSRFYQAHRSDHEKTALAYLCKERDDDCLDAGRWKVVIATQVVEVGLDISADILLTECAPAASLIQRAGRCARDGGAGEVHVFQPPPSPYADSQQPNYTPYIDDGLEEVSRRTWGKLTSTDFDGAVLQYDKEQQLIQAAHEEHDKAKLIDGLGNKINHRIEQIIECMAAPQREGYIHQLIRESSGTSLYIMRDFNSTAITEKYYMLEGFNVSQGRIKHAMDTLTERGIEADWYFRFRDAGHTVDDDEDLYPRTVYQWQPLQQANDAYQHWHFLANPDAIGYTKSMGLVWRPLSKPAIEAPEKHKPSYQGEGYAADTYVQHLQGLYDAYTTVFTLQSGRDTETFYRPLKHEYQYALLRLLRQMGRDDDWDTIDRYLRLMLALHDVGKLNQRWQTWALARHRLYVEMNGTVKNVPTDGEPLAHTVKGWQKFATKADENAYEDKFRALRVPARGTHSVESAEAVQAIIASATGDDELWTAVITAAICHHHSPNADSINSTFEIVANGAEAIATTLQKYDFDTDAVAWSRMVQPKFKRHGRGIKQAMKLTKPNRSNYYRALLYAIFVRILRLADQRSSDYVHKRT